jgi:hypothetical protein
VPRTSVAWICCVLAAPPLYASPLGLDSQPQGVYLRIDGPTRIAGTTPLDVETWPRGDYRLTVEWTGFASARARLRSDGQQGLALRSAAGPAALLAPPGYPHLRGGEPARGVILLAAGTTGGIGLAGAFNDVGEAEDLLDLAQDAYDSAVSEEAITQARIALESASERVDDERQMQLLWAGYTSVVWIGSGLEAWLFTPSPALHSPVSGRYVLSLPRAGAAGATWRSALYPGAGQRYLGREFMSNLLSTGFFGATAAALFAQDWYLEAERSQAYAQRRYDAAENESDVQVWRRELVETADEAQYRNLWRWGLLGAAGAFYVWNLLDAALAGSESARHSDVAWTVLPNSHGALAVVSWRLP